MFTGALQRCKWRFKRSEEHFRGLKWVPGGSLESQGHVRRTQGTSKGLMGFQGVPEGLRGVLGSVLGGLKGVSRGSTAK